MTTRRNPSLMHSTPRIRTQPQQISSAHRLVPYGLLLLFLLVPLRPAAADDWPQWMGPQRDGVWHEKGTISKFPADGPVVKWRIPIAGGYSGPAVFEKLVYVMDYVTDDEFTPSPDQRNQLKGTERVLCVDRDSGELIWKHEYPCAYEISYPAGPRATPTVDGDMVYTLGAEGNLCCLNRRNGRLIWQRDFKNEYRAKTPIWGFCGHPLVDGDRLICIVGGPGSLVVAFDKKTGKEIWRSLDYADQGYSAPTMIEAGGTRQLLIWHSAALSSVNPETGEAYWSEPFDPNYGMSIICPVKSDNLLFIGGIVDKSMMLRLDDRKPQASVVWVGKKDVGIDPVHSTPLADDGILYGVEKGGGLSAVRMDNGQILWTTYEFMPDQRRAHSGTIFLVKNQDRHFLMTDSGELAIVRLTPRGCQVLDRAKIIEPTGNAMGRAVVWSHPAFANRCVFCRNDKELICVDLAIQSP